jgi:hypothetical protein
MVGKSHQAVRPSLNGECLVSYPKWIYGAVLQRCEAQFRAVFIFQPKSHSEKVIPHPPCEVVTGCNAARMASKA